VLTGGRFKQVEIHQTFYKQKQKVLFDIKWSLLRCGHYHFIIHCTYISTM